MVRIGVRQVIGIAFIAWGAAFCMEGCKLKKGAGEDAGAVATAEAPDTGAAPAATDTAAAAAQDAGPKLAEPANANDVARFPGETKVAPEATKIQANTVIVHKVPPSTGLVATLNKGTDVTKVASFGEDFLIQFANPKTATEQLVGWVSKSAFSATPTPAKKACTKPQELFADGNCHTQCQKADQCPKGQLCNGVEMRASLDGGATSPVNFCQPAPDAGAPTAAADAGAPKLTCKNTQVAALFPNEKAATCRKPCKNDGDCKNQKGACASAKAPDGKAVTACINE